MKIILKNLEDTEKIGEIIGKNLKKGTVICLEGDLGAGKTTLTQSIARGLEINDYVTSPTFNIIKEYHGRLDLYHIDAYRLSSEDEMYDLGYDEYIGSDGVCIIEWPSIISGIIPYDAVKINIIANYETGERELEIISSNEKFDEVIRELERI